MRNRAQYVRLYVGGINRKSSVRRLVYETFVGDLKPGQCILHRNCDDLDDSVWNLVITDRRGIGSFGGKRNNYRCVEWLDESGNVIGVFRNCKDAAKASFYSATTVLQHCKRKVRKPKFRFEKTVEAEE